MCSGKAVGQYGSSSFCCLLCGAGLCNWPFACFFVCGAVGVQHCTSEGLRFGVGRGLIWTECCRIVCVCVHTSCLTVHLLVYTATDNDWTTLPPPLGGKHDVTCSSTNVPHQQFFHAWCALNMSNFFFLVPHFVWPPRLLLQMYQFLTMYEVCLWQYNAILFGTWAPTFWCKFGEVFYFVLLNVTVNCHCIASAGRETCPSAILSTNCCNYRHARSFTSKHLYLYQTGQFTSKRMVNFMVTATKPPTWHWKYEFWLASNGNPLQDLCCDSAAADVAICASLTQCTSNA